MKQINTDRSPLLRRGLGGFFLNVTLSLSNGGKLVILSGT